MKGKLFVFVSLVVVLTMLLGACAAPAAQQPGAATTTAPAAATPAGATEGAAAPAGDIYIPVVSQGFQHEFWQAVRKGSEKAAQDYGVRITFEGPESETMVDKQVEMLQAAIDKKPQAICLAALDSKAVIPLLERAQAANIPVIGFDSGVDSDILVTTAATDNVAASAAAADKLAELIGEEGEVAAIIQDQTSTSGRDRRDGFVNRIKEKYPKITIVDVQYGAGDHLKSTDLAKAIIQAHPNLKGFYGANEGSVVGVLNGVSELKKEGKIVVVGFDSGQQQIDAIRRGIQAGAITQDPIGIGYKCVEAAVKTLKGEKLPKTIDTGFHWYDKTNLDSEEIKPLLYH